jgi:hypothetical protein
MYRDMKQDADCAVLRLFNQKVERLFSLSFFSKAQGAGAVVEFQRESGWESIFVGPDEESIEALVLTLRMFMQDNDRISLRKMRELYQALSVSPDLGQTFSSICAELNSFLDSDTNLSIEEGRQLSHREILKVFVYGTYAHTNEDLHGIFTGIRSTAFFPIFQSHLIVEIKAFATSLRKLSAVNNKALKELDARV